MQLTREQSTASHALNIDERTVFERIDTWYASKGWHAFDFQRQCWNAYLDRENYLLHSTTGSGKTLAAFLGPVIEFLLKPAAVVELEKQSWTHVRGRQSAPPLTVLWITPLKALSTDTEQALSLPVGDLALPWTIERRTGDSSASLKASQRKRLPTVLVITPESLTLMLSYPESTELFRHLRSIVVDEWHELIGTKRGIQTELALTRLQMIAPKARRCGLSATLGNLQQALDCLCGNSIDAISDDSVPSQHVAEKRLIHSTFKKEIEVKSLRPINLERFPWAGHLGITMIGPVVEAIDHNRSTLVFTNTRNQTEYWYQQILKVRPDWAGQLALHHGSLDSAVRLWVESAMRAGKLKAVVCTSSLDLGVDFSVVDQVIQIGSPKGAARLLQRAGRSGHSPGAISKLTFAATHSLELLELAAARDLISFSRSDPSSLCRSPNDNEHITLATTSVNRLESRTPIECPLDCLAQHAVTRALVGPYTRSQLFYEIRTAYSYRNLTLEDLEWVLRFVVHGGDSLKAYPDFHRVHYDGQHYAVIDKHVARKHRMAIGTIASDVSMQVQYASGKKLGTVEESFIARLKQGDRFQFAGKTLELIQMREGNAIVRKSTKPPNTFPRWQGGRMPLSSQLSHEVRELLHEASEGYFRSHEMQYIESTLAVQKQRSLIPKRDMLLVESFAIKSNYYCCFYPLDGRLVHEGLSSVFAYRLSKLRPISLSMAVNDYGFSLQANEPLMIDRHLIDQLLSPIDLAEDLLHSLNTTELSKRQFREIARIAGLIHPGIPGQPKRAKHLQASSNMFFDAFREFDPGNLLLEQARREVLRDQLEFERILKTLERIQSGSVQWLQLKKPTPMAFPLVVEQMKQRISSDSLENRVRKLQKALELDS